MKQTPFKILLVGTFNDKITDLIALLKRHDYVVDSALSIEMALQKIMEEETDLIIGSKKINGYYGFEVYSQLKKSVINAGVPFLMNLDEFEKEDVLIGLEMGIDNFIFSPFNEAVVIHSIENEIKKKKEINLFETKGFKRYFLSTSVAMFFKSNGKISLVNEAFIRLTGACNMDVLGKPVKDLFQLEASETNRMNYHRFKSGAASECLLKNVQYCNNKESRFNITFYRGKAGGTNAVFAELVRTYFAEIVVPQKNVSIANEFANGKVADTGNTEIGDSENIHLTEREQAVFELSANGLPIKVIADKLNLSDRTVEKHRANIMAKTNAKNIIEAIIRIRKGKNTDYFFGMGY